MKDLLPWQGKWIAFLNGQKFEVLNKITDAGLNWYMDLWRGVGEPGFKYIALGTSDTPVEYSDTILGAEQYRSPIQTFTPAAPILQSIVTFSDTEALFVIKEIGLFAGATATADLNTGILVARAVVNIDHTQPGSLKIIREDRLGRVS
ncbi:MAG: hypothetical protein M1489_04595 [Firmicutes bacterium]|nr:hypothetical protein [Bacillota bacterium]